MASLLTPEDNNLALSQGLLGLGAGLLSGSFGHYGAFGPALGQGVQGFQQGHSNAIQSVLQRKQLEQQQALQQAQIGNYNSEVAKRDADIAAQQRKSDLAKRADAYARSQFPKPMQPGMGPRKTDPVSGAIVGQNAPFPQLQGVNVGTDLQTPTVEVTGVSPSDLQNPKYHELRAQFYLQEGDREGAMEAIKQARELRKEHAAEDEAPKTQMMPIGNGMEQMFQWDKGLQSWQKTGEPRPIFNPNPLVNNNLTVSTEKDYSKAFAGKIADSDVAYRDAATKAPDLATRANSMLEVLDTGKVITGFGADYRLALGKALGLVGASDKETIANTEALSVDQARNTLDAIKASGLGSGSGFSNADRDFLEKAAGGKITLEKATIERLARLSHKAAELSAKKWNDRVKMIPDSALQGTGLTRDPVQVPGVYQPKKMAPKGQGPTVGDVVDGYRYKGGDPGNQNSWEKE